MIWPFILHPSSFILMQILLAPDKFKGCLSAQAVAQAMARGIARVASEAQVDLCPLADGGEGTVDALVSATGGKIIRRRVTGPLPEMKVEAALGLLGDGQTAVIEMAAASGLALLRSDQRDPMATTTYGTGELLMAAAELGAKKIILGIGGSATTDGGVGCLQACGLPILLEGGEPVSPSEPLTGRDLHSILFIKHGRGSPVERCQIIVACDVSNPLFGPDGAATVYGPQKGASPRQVQQLDADLRLLAERTGQLDAARSAGAGAAGGLGFAMRAFLNAQLRSGIDIVMDAVDLDKRLAGADLCLTGEGRLDASSLSGKTTIGVARRCKALKIPCVALVGAAETGTGEAAKQAREQGLTAWWSICNRPITLQKAMEEAPDLLAESAAQVLQLFSSLHF
jgi:glycerate kinase